MHVIIYANVFSILSTVPFRRNRILSLVRSITKGESKANTYTAYELLITATIMKTTKEESL